MSNSSISMSPSQTLTRQSSSPHDQQLSTLGSTIHSIWRVLTGWTSAISTVTGATAKHSLSSSEHLDPWEHRGAECGSPRKPPDLSQLSASELRQQVDRLQKDLLSLDPQVLGPERKQLLQDLLDLVSKCKWYPSQLDLEDVRCDDRRIFGMGRVADVYKGHYNGRVVAMKHLRAFNMVQPSQKPGLVESFHYETVRWFNLQHPNILPFFGVIDAAELGGLCMVSPWCEDGTIRHYLDHIKLSGPGLVKILNSLLRDISNGLAHLHDQRIVHGDLRGSNVMIDGDLNPRIADYGVVQITEQARDYPNLDKGGSAGWQAPELFEPEDFGLQSSIPTEASDVYAFACLCVELYTRQNPFPNQREIKIVTKVLKGHRPERPAAPAEDMSEDFWRLVNQAWTSKPQKRPPALEIAERLGSL